MAATRASEAAWAVVPLDMNGAAAALGVSRRTLVDAIKSNPFYERRGVKKVFYPEHISALRRGMHQCGSQSNGLKAGPPSTAQAPMVSGSDALSKLVTLAKQKKQERR